MEVFSGGWCVYGIVLPTQKKVYPPVIDYGWKVLTADVIFPLKDPFMMGFFSYVTGGYTKQHRDRTGMKNHQLGYRWIINSWIVGIPSCNLTQKANWKPWPIWKLQTISIANSKLNFPYAPGVSSNDFFLRSSNMVFHGSHGGSHEKWGCTSHEIGDFTINRYTLWLCQQLAIENDYRNSGFTQLENGDSP